MEHVYGTTLAADDGFKPATSVWTTTPDDPRGAGGATAPQQEKTMAQTLHINVVMHGHHVLVQAAGKERLYADIPTVLAWLRDVHRRCLDQHRPLAITTARTLGSTLVHDDDRYLRAEIGDSSVGPCLSA